MGKTIVGSNKIPTDEEFAEIYEKLVDRGPTEAEMAQVRETLAPASACSGPRRTPIPEQADR